MPIITLETIKEYLPKYKPMGLPEESDHREGIGVTTSGSHALFCPWCGVNLREDYAKKGEENA